MKTMEDPRSTDPTTYGRIAWMDRFNAPTTDQLRESLTEDAQELYDDALVRLRALEGVEESMAWHGDTWRWVVEFRDADLDAERPLAIVIPAPDDVQVAMPFVEEFAHNHSVKRMKRAIRDGFELARAPYETNWGVWSLAPGSFNDDLFDLLRQKMKWLAKQQKG